MIRMPLATASLLAIAISLAGCGEGKDKAAAPQAPTPAASTTAPAAATPAGQVDEAAAKAVVAHYADMVFAVYSDAESTAKTLQTAIDEDAPFVPTLQACAACAATLRIPLRDLLHYHGGVRVFRTRQLLLDVQAISRRRSPVTSPPSDP